MLKGSAVVALFFVLIVIGAIIGFHALPGQAVLCVGLEPEPISFFPPSLQGVDIKPTVKLQYQPNLFGERVSVSRGNYDPLIDYEAGMVWRVTINVYGSSSELLFTGKFSFDGGFKREIKIYNATFAELQPLRVVLDIYFKVVRGETVLFERLMHLEKSGVTA